MTACRRNHRISQAQGRQYWLCEKANLPQKGAFATHVGPSQHNEARGLTPQLNVIGDKGPPTGYPHPSCWVSQRLCFKDLPSAHSKNPSLRITTFDLLSPLAFLGPVVAA